MSSKIQINNNRTGTWIKTCRIEDLNSSGLLDFDYENKKILIVKVGNRIYATDRICTHAYADLSTGFLNETERTITCPLHMSNFNLENGMPQNLPAEEPLKTYNIKLENDWVWILVNK